MTYRVVLFTIEGEDVLVLHMRRGTMDKAAESDLFGYHARGFRGNVVHKVCGPVPAVSKTDPARADGR